MAMLRWILGSVVVLGLTACGTDAGGGGADAATGDLGDSQIAPQDTAATDATTPGDAADAATDAVGTDAVGADAGGTDAVGTDTSDTADTFTPQSCVGSGGSSCTNGETCWTAPCPKCGVMPQGVCVPPLKGGGCYDYTHCTAGDCHNADPMNGVAGWCLPVVTAAGKCWPNASELIPDCYPGASCQGASICPQGAECLVADKPGTCTPAAAQNGSVYLWERNGGIVSPGEAVIVTWINLTSASIFLPGCSTYSIQTSPDSQVWTDKGPAAQCVWEGTAVEVPAGGYVDTMSWQAPNGTGTVGNYRFHGTYSTGCKAGQPISTGGCTGSGTADSTAFFVGYVP